jgi:hypothetical protein
MLLEWISSLEFSMMVDGLLCIKLNSFSCCSKESSLNFSW